MVAHIIVRINCVTIIFLFQLYGSILEWSWAPAAQTDDLCAVDCHVFFYFFLVKWFLILPLLHVLWILGITSCFTAAFSRFLLLCFYLQCYREEGGQKMSYCLSPVCPRCSFSASCRKKLKFTVCMWQKCFWGQVFKCNIVKLFLANCCPYSAV